MKGIYKSFGGEVSSRYYDLICGEVCDEEKDKKKAEEIIGNIRSKLGGLK